MIDKDEVLEAYTGMTYRESVDHQVKYWAKGIPTHNPVGDECCPDFSCCCPDLLANDEARRRFLIASDSGDDELKTQMLMGFLGAAFDGHSIHIAGDSPDATEH